jgi:hypothetical protein
MMSDEVNRQPRDHGVLLRIATESWRFSRSFLALVRTLDLKDQNRHLASMRFFQRQLTDALRELGYELADLEGHRFDPGLPITVLNLSEFEAGDLLMIDQMLEPVILRGGAVVRTGTGLARRIDP